MVKNNDFHDTSEWKIRLIQECFNDLLKTTMKPMWLAQGRVLEMKT